MAYWEFDLTFTNLGALPAGAHVISVFGMFSNSDYLSFEDNVPASGDLTITLSTAAPAYNDPPFELSSEVKVWFEVTVLAAPVFPNPAGYLSMHLLGPYTVGDIGTEVPAP